MNYCPALIYAHWFLLAHRNCLHMCRIHNRRVFTMSTVLYVLHISLVLKFYTWIHYFLNANYCIVYMGTPVYIVYASVPLHTNNIWYMRKTILLAQVFLHTRDIFYMHPVFYFLIHAFLPITTCNVLSTRRHCCMLLCRKTAFSAGVQGPA
jgi:hypothetical protein